MIIDLKQHSEAAQIECDICIMGGGPAGITTALELEAEGLDIVLIEGGGLNYDMSSQNLYSGTTSSKYYPPHNVSRLRFLGGATNHWEGSCRPLESIDFEKRDWVPHSGWPISKAELDPYYEVAHRYCNLNEFNYEIDYWEKRSQLKRLYDEPKILKTVVNQHSTPVRFGTEYRSQLQKSPNIRVYLNANVTNLNEDGDSSSIRSITLQVLDGVSGSVKARQFILAMGGLENSRMLLLSRAQSAEGIGNEYDNVGRYYMDHPGVKAAAIVPNAAWPKQTKILAKAPVNFIHWTYQMADELVSQQQLVNSRLTLSQKSHIEMSSGIESMHQISKAFKKDREIDSYFDHMSNIILDMDMVAEAISRKALDTELFSYADEPAGYIVNAMMEQTPDPHNRITLSQEKDELGLNRLHLDWKVSEFDKNNMERLIEHFAKSLSKSRYCRVRSLIGENDDTERRYEELMDYGYHHIGGTRMSSTPRSGVVDKNLKVFGRKNLYIVGSSVFPTGGYVPPTLTIVALAARLASHISSGYKKYE